VRCCPSAYLPYPSLAVGQERGFLVSYIPWFADVGPSIRGVSCKPYAPTAFARSLSYRIYIRPSVSRQL